MFFQFWKASIRGETIVKTRKSILTSLAVITMLAVGLTPAFGQDVALLDPVVTEGGVLIDLDGHTIAGLPQTRIGVRQGLNVVDAPISGARVTIDFYFESPQKLPEVVIIFRGSVQCQTPDGNRQAWEDGIVRLPKIKSLSLSCTLGTLFGSGASTVVNVEFPFLKKRPIVFNITAQITGIEEDDTPGNNTVDVTVVRGEGQLCGS